MSGANKLYLSPRILFSHYTIFIVYPLQGESNIDTFSCRKSNRVVRYNFWNRVASKKCFLSPFLWVCEVWMSCRQVWEPSPARAFVPNWEAQEDIRIKALFQTGGGSLKINFLSPSFSSSAVFMGLWEPPREGSLVVAWSDARPLTRIYKEAHVCSIAIFVCFCDCVFT